jgi:hypothetical protein
MILATFTNLTRHFVNHIDCLKAVKQYRKIVGQLITAVCFLRSQGLAFRDMMKAGHLLTEAITMRF